MNYRYVPIIRTKSGEADALGNLSAAARMKVFPLIRLTRTIPQTFLTKMTNLAAGMPMSLDGTYNVTVTGTVTNYQNLFHGLGAGGIPIIPVLSYNASQAYNSMAAQMIGNYAAGFMLHIPLDELSNLAQWIASVPQSSPNEIDIVIDAGCVADYDPILRGNSIGNTINSFNLPAQQWRSITLHSWSAPRDVGQLTAGRNDILRHDWLTWQQARTAVNFSLDYSDSAHLHPSLEEVPGPAMANATVSVRYAVDDMWIIHKGSRISGPNGISMRTQYRNHSLNLIADPQFGGINGCWGDTRIQHYATTTNGTGGRSQWAAILLNRHISLVADRIP